MKANEAIIAIIEKKGIKKSDMARAFGVRPQSIDNRLNKTANPTISNVNELLDHLGYEIVFAPKGAKTLDDAYLIESDIPVREGKRGRPKNKKVEVEAK